MKILGIKIILIACVLSALGQKKIKPASPKVGEPLPQFILADVNYYARQRVTPKDFLGKWLIIDCWNRYCSSCESSFPKTDSMQKEFSDRLQFLLVGYTGSQYMPKWGPDDKHIKSEYEEFRQKENLQLAIAFDSTLFHRFDIGGCPFEIIVDPNGIVRGVTYEIDRKDIQDFLDGKTPKLPKIMTLSEEKALRKQREKAAALNN